MDDPKDARSASTPRTGECDAKSNGMKFVASRPYADPEAAMRKILEIANAFTPIQDGRVYIEAINFLRA